MSNQVTSVCLALKSTSESPIPFKARGFMNMSPGRVSDVPVYAFPSMLSLIIHSHVTYDSIEEARVQYDLRLANIAGYAYSHHHGTTSFQPISAGNIMSAITDLPALQFNKLEGVFKLDNPTDDQVNIMTTGGLKRDSQNLNVFRGTPTFKSFAAIMAMDPATYRPGPMETTPDGIVAYMFLVKGMAVFSTLSGTFAKQSGGISFAGTGIGDQGHVDMEFGRAGGTVGLDFNAPGWAVAKTTALHCVTVPSSSSRKFTMGYSAITSVTGTPFGSDGRFFPYFTGMVLPDRGFAYTVFNRIFPQLLNSDLSKVPLLLQRIKKGAASIAHSIAGMAISHAYLGISLAIQSHSAIHFIITREEYQGFILAGDFNLVLYKDVIDGLPEDDCIADLQLLNTHDRAMLQLKKEFEIKKLIDGETVYPFDIDSLNTSRRLLGYLKGIPESEYADIPDFWKQVDKLVDQLDFGDEWEVIGTSSIEEFLNFVQTGDERLLADKPAFLRGGYFRSCRNNKIATGLAMFGPKAPSCNFGPKGITGFVIPIPKIGNPDSNLADDGALKKLPFQSMHPISATAQWTTLFAEGVIRLPKGDPKRNEFCKMSGVAYHLHRGAMPAFVSIYDRIKTYSSTIRSSTGSKRKGAVTEERGNGGPSKKSKSNAGLGMF
jgi:hypothetical protein